MIYGVEAQNVPAQSPFEPPVSSSLIASADFVNGIYSFDGSTVTLASIITETAHVSGSGLVIEPQSTVLNDFLALLNTMNWTVVVEYVPNSGAFTTNTNIAFIDGIRTAQSDNIQVYSFEGVGGFWEENAAGSNQFTEDPTHPSTVNVVNKIACTRTATHTALSINGNAIIQNNSPKTIITDTFYFCSASAAGLGFVHKIEIYGVQADSELPVLSAP